MESDEQLAHLLQHLHNTGVPEDIRINVLKDPVVQIAFNQVLNELEIMKKQCDEAHKDLYCAALEVWKITASPEINLPQKVH